MQSLFFYLCGLQREIENTNNAFIPPRTERYCEMCGTLMMYSDQLTTALSLTEPNNDCTMRCNYEYCVTLSGALSRIMLSARRKTYTYGFLSFISTSNFQLKGNVPPRNVYCAH